MDIKSVNWIGHAGFLIREKGLNIYIDPFSLKSASEKADIIFITHPHTDHLDSEGIKKIAESYTVFIAPKEAKQKLPYKNVIEVKPFDKGEVKGVSYECLPAYNTKEERLNFHPKKNDWVGYIIKMGGFSIYHPGDTDLIEEMKKVSVDLALIPCGGTYGMDFEDAIAATKVISAKQYAPMHYKALLGKEQGERLEKLFRQRVKNAIIMTEIQEPVYSLR